MKETLNIIKGIAAAIGGALSFLLGDINGLVYALTAFVLIDYATGIMCAILNKKLSSEIGFKGIFKKALIFLMVGIAHIADVNLLESSSVLRDTTIFFYLANEGISILENAAVLDLPIPQKIKDILEQLKKK